MTKANRRRLRLSLGALLLAGWGIVWLGRRYPDVVLMLALGWMAIGSIVFGVWKSVSNPILEREDERPKLRRVV